MNHNPPGVYEITAGLASINMFLEYSFNNPYQIGKSAVDT
mgnify:FL=1